MMLTVFEAIEFIISDLQQTLIHIEEKCKLDKKILQLKDEGWTIQEILEHIYLTNHYLLILIRKGVKKALNNINQLDLSEEIKKYRFNPNKFKNISLPGKFIWDRPNHMVPNSEKDILEVNKLIHHQFHECYNYLDQLINGEGLLYQTTMTVDQLGKLNVYEYIYFLNQHCKRHLVQIDNILQTNKLEGF